MIVYDNLRKEMLSASLTNMIIACEIGISDGEFLAKVCGKIEFDWEEIKCIQQRFFPEFTKEYLFSTM